MIHPFFDLQLRSPDGQPIALRQFEGKKILIVNVANHCGFFRQMGGILRLQQENREALQVICCPSRNFFQESRDNKEIAFEESCLIGDEKLLHSELLNVRGKNIHPLYAFLTQKKLNGVRNARVWWNYQKFLVDEQGRWQAVFSPMTTVSSPDLIRELGQPIKGLMETIPLKST